MAFGLWLEVLELWRKCPKQMFLLMLLVKWFPFVVGAGT